MTVLFSFPTFRKKHFFLTLEGKDILGPAEIETLERVASQAEETVGELPYWIPVKDADQPAPTP